MYLSAFFSELLRVKYWKFTCNTYLYTFDNFRSSYHFIFVDFRISHLFYTKEPNKVYFIQVEDNTLAVFSE